MENNIEAIVPDGGQVPNAVPAQEPAAAQEPLAIENTGASVKIDEGQQKEDIAALESGLDNPEEIQPLPEEEYAGKISAWGSKGLLKVLRAEVEEPKKFHIGDDVPLNSEEKYEVPEPSMTADELLKNSTADFDTDDLWQTNFNQLSNEDDVNGLIAAVSENMQGQIMEARGGIVRDEEVIKLANDLGADAGFISEFVNSSKNDFISPEKILAARTVLNKSATYLHDLAKLVANGNANDKQKLAFKKQFAFHQQFMGQFMAKRANIGRALRAYGLPAGSGDAQQDHIEEMLHSVHGGLDLKAAAKQLAAAPNAKGINTMVQAQDSLARKGGNAFIELFVNSILSGVKTHIINTTGSALAIGMKTVDTALAARLGTTPDDIAMKVDKDEWKAGVFGMMNGTADAFSTMVQVGRTAEAYGGVSKLENTGRAYISAEYLGVENKHVAQGVDWLGHIIRAPTERLMGGIDGFMKVIAERQSLAATAYRMVNAESDAQGWNQKQTLARLEELMSNPTDGMIADANENALHVTFQTPLGEWGKTIQKGAGANPFTQFFMPFVKTPANLMKQGFLERTPLAFITRQYQDDITAGGARAQMAKARVVTGTSMIMAAGGLAAAGKITGAGPDNWESKKALLDSGWRPYSFVSEDSEGKKTYISYQRTEPYSYIFATIADFHDTIKLAPTSGEDNDRFTERLTGALVTAVSHATLDRSFMTGLENAMEVLSDPTDSKVSGFIKRMNNSLIPYSGTRRDLTRLFDDTKKITDGTLQEIQANIPYFNSSLPSRLDSLGLEVKYDNVLNPLPIVGEKQNLILDEAARIATSINRNPLSLPQRTIEGVRLSGAQYHKLVLLSRNTTHGGDHFHKAITTILKDSDYSAAGVTDDMKYTLLRETVSEFDGIARKILLSEDRALALKISARSSRQAAESISKTTGQDADSVFIRLQRDVNDAYNSAK